MCNKYSLINLGNLGDFYNVIEKWQKVIRKLVVNCVTLDKASEVLKVIVLSVEMEVVPQFKIFLCMF